MSEPSTSRIKSFSIHTPTPSSPLPPQIRVLRKPIAPRIVRSPGNTNPADSKQLQASEKLTLRHVAFQHTPPPTPPSSAGNGSRSSINSSGSFPTRRTSFEDIATPSPTSDHYTEGRVGQVTVTQFLARQGDARISSQSSTHPLIHTRILLPHRHNVQRRTGLRKRGMGLRWERLIHLDGPSAYASNVARECSTDRRSFCAGTTTPHAPESMYGSMHSNSSHAPRASSLEHRRMQCEAEFCSSPRCHNLEDFPLPPQQRPSMSLAVKDRSSTTEERSFFDDDDEDRDRRSKVKTLMQLFTKGTKSLIDSRSHDGDGVRKIKITGITGTQPKDNNIVDRLRGMILCGKPVLGEVG